MKKLLIILTLGFLVIGCTKELDLAPIDSLSDASFWKTSGDYKMAATNLYESLRDRNWVFPMDDLESDITFSTSANEISNGTYLVTETDGDWNQPYLYIRRCNTLIAAESKAPVEEAEAVKQYIAEAKFFRAWNYWSLYKKFGGVVIIDKVMDTNSEELYNPRSTRKETVDFILQDLADAIPLLPLQSEVPNADKGRVTKGAAEALIARVALFEGTWNKYHGLADANFYLDKAIEAANNIVISGEYSLFTGLGTDNSYWGLFIEVGDDSPESILDDRYLYPVRTHDFTRKMLRSPGYLATKKLADMYLCSDGLPVSQSPLFGGYETRISEFENRDPRMTQTIVIPGEIHFWGGFAFNPVPSWPFYPSLVATTGYTMNKFRTDDPTGNSDAWGRYGFGRRVLRYGEVLLNLAEALFERNGNISDADLNRTINVLRDRVGMPHLTNAFVTANSLNMKEEIRRERTIELALEGFRPYDLRRWKTAETELPQALRGIKIVGTQWGTEQILVSGANANLYMLPAWQSRADAEGFLVCEPAEQRFFDPDKHYLRPLPTKEIQINPKLEQNPNW